MNAPTSLPASSFGTVTTTAPALRRSWTHRALRISATAIGTAIPSEISLGLSWLFVRDVPRDPYTVIDQNSSPRPLFRFHCILVLPPITRSLHGSHCPKQHLPHGSTKHVPTTTRTNTRLRAVQPLSGLCTALRPTQAPDLLTRWVVWSHWRREIWIREQCRRGECNAP